MECFARLRHCSEYQLCLHHRQTPAGSVKLFGLVMMPLRWCGSQPQEFLCLTSELRIRLAEIYEVTETNVYRLDKNMKTPRGDGWATRLGERGTHSNDAGMVSAITNQKDTPLGCCNDDSVLLAGWGTPLQWIRPSKPTHTESHNLICCIMAAVVTCSEK